MNYQKQHRFHGVGSVVFATETVLGVWGYRPRRAQSQAGYMLTIINRKSGETIQHLVPVHKTLFSLFLSGSATLAGGKIFAITANTGYIDIIDFHTFQTTRLDPHDGVYHVEPLPWKKWKAKNFKAMVSRERAIRAWQATFSIPIDIAVVGNRMIVLYAKGERYFYDQRDLNGALISRNHGVPIPHPRINGSRLEGIVVDEADRQYYAYIDLL